MGRNPKIRLNFDSDVQYLLRFKHALEEDTGYPKEFREGVIGKVHELTMLLMKAPQKKVVGEVEVPRRRARG